MRYKIEFKYRYGEDYVYCNEYRQDDWFVQPLKEEGPIVLDSLQVDQLLKALYWIPEKLKKDHQEFGFGELISCLTCLAYKAQAE